MEACEAPFPDRECPDLVFVTAGNDALKKTMAITDVLRRDGYAVLFDTMERSVKAQMKFAGKTGARFTAVIGDNELVSGKVLLKNMRSGAQTELAFSSFEEDFERAVLSDCVDGIADTEI